MNMNFCKQVFVGIFWFGLLSIGVIGIAMLDKSRPHNSSPVRSITTAAEAPQIITVGNNSYVPLNLSGGIEQNASTILNTIQLFESFHPDLHVTHFHVERTYYASGAGYVFNDSNHILGVWLTHEPR